MNSDLDERLAKLDELWTKAGRRGLELAVRARLCELPREEFSVAASELLDAARALVDHGRTALAKDLAGSVVSATRSWAQRHGQLGAYSDGLAARGREFIKFMGGPDRSSGPVPTPRPAS